MFDWDDLRIFLAAARCGSLTAAAHQLGLDAATVGRRIARLESALRATLLVRSRAGLQLTAAGSELRIAGEEAEAAMTKASFVGHADVAAGAIRLSVAEGFGTRILAPALPLLSRQYPALRIELAAHAGFLSPHRREVDMAVTLSPPPETRLVVEPLAPYQLALFAHRNYLEAIADIRTIDDLKRVSMIGYIDDLIYAPELRYLDELSPGLRPQLSSTSIQAQREILLAGGGGGVLPFFLADGLVRVLPNDVLLERRFWLSTHEDIYGSARMRAVERWLRGLVDAASDVLAPATVTASI